jgi:FKBP-type peptidyl-prolyl cis-trans isomerase
MARSGWWTAVLAVVLAAVAAVAVAAAGQVKIETTFTPSSCAHVAKNGDKLKVHYRGKLTNGKQFDASYDRGQPLPLTLGARQVIVGWEEGLQGMCLGEKRTLTIPPEKGYGSRGAGSVIPPDATLIFETELVAIGEHTYQARASDDL